MKKKRAEQTKVIDIKPITCLTATAAKYLGIPEATLKKSRSTGILYGIATPPYRKVGNAVFYEYKKLDEWMSKIPVFANAADEQLKSL